LDADQVHYLKNVLRRKEGDTLRLFNGKDGEFDGALKTLERKSATLTLTAKTRPQAADLDLWLAAPLLKKETTDFLVQKATEVGVIKICLMITEYTNAKQVNTERLQKIAVEAAEQSERLTVPVIEEPVKLHTLMDQWPHERPLLVGDETHAARPIAEIIDETPSLSDHEKAGIMIGPEGGFSEPERTLFKMHHFLHPVDLGPRILRAETAAIFMASVWQSLKF